MLAKDAKKLALSSRFRPILDSIIYRAGKGHSSLCVESLSDEAICVLKNKGYKIDKLDNRIIIRWE